MHRREVQDLGRDEPPIVEPDPIHDVFETLRYVSSAVESRAAQHGGRDDTERRWAKRTILQQATRIDFVTAVGIAGEDPVMPRVGAKPDAIVRRSPLNNHCDIFLEIHRTPLVYFCSVENIADFQERQVNGLHAERYLEISRLGAPASCRTVCYGHLT